MCSVPLSLSLSLPLPVSSPFHSLSEKYHFYNLQEPGPEHHRQGQYIPEHASLSKLLFLWLWLNTYQKQLEEVYFSFHLPGHWPSLKEGQSFCIYPRSTSVREGVEWGLESVQYTPRHQTLSTKTLPWRETGVGEAASGLGKSNQQKAAFFRAHVVCVCCCCCLFLFLFLFL